MSKILRWIGIGEVDVIDLVLNMSDSFLFELEKTIACEIERRGAPFIERMEHKNRHDSTQEHT